MRLAKTCRLRRHVALHPFAVSASPWHAIVAILSRLFPGLCSDGQTVTAHWPAGIRAGVEYVMPAMQ
jgi:hypothetical protein